MNKKLLLVLPFCFFSITIFGQSIIDISENTIKVNALEEQVLYYGFAQGDQLIFNFETIDGKELKEIDIIEMPTSSKFADYKSTKIVNKTLNIAKDGIYKFRFYNSSLAKRICKIKIQRIPLSEKTKNFNSSVYWKTRRDTTYTPREERYLSKSENVVKEIYSGNPQISSTNAFNGNKNYQIVNFDLPENTVSWSFYIGTGNEGKAAYDKARDNFTEEAASSFSKLSVYGPMAALAFTGVSYFNKVQGEDNVKYWFLNDINSVNLFQSGQTFYSYKMGDVVNEASQMTAPLNGKIYLALWNDNTIDPIKVTLKITAIQLFQHWETRTIKVMNVVDRQEAYLQN
jgi:hypothetical protein